MNNEIEYLKKYLKENNLDESNINSYIEELKKGKPIQYIIGNVNFYGYPIKVNENTLIPRFETERLVELTIKKIKYLFPNKKIDIIDLGTGSGCIAISLEKNTNSNIDALDISKEALEVAKYNAKINNSNINFINYDMTKYQEKRYDVIISNPPYIRYDEEIMDIVKNNEPHLALYAEDEGLYFYKKIINNLKYLTKEKFLVAFEIGYEQSSAITKYATENLSNISIETIKDYSNKDRYIFITSK